MQMNDKEYLPGYAGGLSVGEDIVMRTMWHDTGGAQWLLDELEMGSRVAEALSEATAGFGPLWELQMVDSWIAPETPEPE